jgi:hypothetical protein
MTTPQLAKFPYPYQAAVTVSSDIDNSSYNRFAAVHTLFCTSEVIRPGSPSWAVLGLSGESPGYDAAAGGVRGLGLDLADSFWLFGDPIGMGMYRYDTQADRFNEDSSDGQSVRQAVQEWLRRGWVDAFHGFLNYRRDQVLPVLKDFYAWCEREGVAKPSVWVNHSMPVCLTGLCPDRFRPNRLVRLARQTARWLIGPMFGRIRRPIRYALLWYQGDNPGSPYYVNDVLAANGLRYVWLCLGPGQDSFANRIDLPERQLNGRPSILDVVTMDDGVRYFQFSRCYGSQNARGEAWPGLRQTALTVDSSVLFTAENFDHLCREEGTSILYTHWTAEPALPPGKDTLARFHLLRRYRDEGRIWVAPLSKVLEWTRLRTFLQYTAREEGGRLVISIEGTEDPVVGRQSLSPQECRGLTFRVPETTATVEIRVAGKTLPPDAVGRSGTVCWVR